MELNFDNIKKYATIAVTVMSGAVSGVFYLKDYLNTNYVSESTFAEFKTIASRNVLENRKLVLENRIYFLNMCKVTPACAYKSTADLEIDKALRELQDIRGYISTINKKVIE